MDNYEKKYNEALAWMRELYPGLHGATKEDAEHYFPELRESEDESIRRTLAEYFGPQAQLDFIRGVPIQKIRDWLEKQKEPKHASDDLQKSFEAGQTSIVDNPEQYGLCKKAEWSEEDEKKRKGLIKGLEDRIGFGWAKDPFSREEYIAWLKSLSPSWKPSEEQVEALKSFLDYHRPIRNGSVQNWQEFDNLESLYEQLKKL